MHKKAKNYSKCKRHITGAKIMQIAENVRHHLSWRKVPGFYSKLQIS